MIALDKQAHFWAGAAIASTVTLYSTPLTGLGVAAIAALGKELFDLSGRGTPDIKDFLCTVAGAIVPLLPMALSQIISS